MSNFRSPSPLLPRTSRGHSTKRLCFGSLSIETSFHWLWSAPIEREEVTWSLVVESDFRRGKEKRIKPPSSLDRPLDLWLLFSSFPPGLIRTFLLLISHWFYLFPENNLELFELGRFDFRCVHTLRVVEIDFVDSCVVTLRAMSGVGENQLISIQPDELKFLCKQLFSTLSPYIFNTFGRSCMRWSSLIGLVRLANCDMVSFSSSQNLYIREYCRWVALLKNSQSLWA